MSDLARYLKLYLAFIRIGLIKEMSFRGNFLIRVATRTLWFIVLCIFFEVVYGKTESLAGWSKYQFLVLLGTHFIVTGIIETFFMPNFSDLSEKVRSGRLDFALSKPIDEQFLLTLQDFDWANLSNVLYGAAMVVYSMSNLEMSGISPWVFVIYFVTIVAGIIIFYSIMTMLAVTAVWLIRNQHLYEMWFYVSVFSRFPPEIFDGPFGSGLQFFLRFIIPILVVVSVPASSLSRGLHEPWLVVHSVLIAGCLLYVSRRVFKGTLKHYRSASS